MWDGWPTRTARTAGDSAGDSAAVAVVGVRDQRGRSPCGRGGCPGISSYLPLDKRCTANGPARIAAREHFPHRRPRGGEGRAPLSRATPVPLALRAPPDPALLPSRGEQGMAGPRILRTSRDPAARHGDDRFTLTPLRSTRVLLAAARGKESSAFPDMGWPVACPGTAHRTAAKHLYALSLPVRTPRPARNGLPYQPEGHLRAASAPRHWLEPLAADKGAPCGWVGRQCLGTHRSHGARH